MKKNTNNKNNESKKKIFYIINIIIILCFIIIVGEIGYGIYSKYFKEEKHIYYDGINSMIKTDNGYVTVGSNNNNNNNYERAKFSIYNSNKEKKIEKIFNKGYNSSFYGVCKSDDGYVAVGSYESNKKDHKKSLRKALMVKYDNKGNVVFENKYKLLDNSKFNSIIKIEDGYIVVGQSIYNNKDKGNDGGAIITRYNNDGKLIWEKTYGSNKSAVYNDVIFYNGYLYSVGKDNDNLGIIVKYDLDGNFINSNDYKYTDTLGFTGIVELEDDLYVSTGKRITSNDSDAMIVKYNLDLDYIDEESYNGGNMERFNKIIKDSKNHIILIGNGYIREDDSSVNCDGIIAKYNTSLNKIAVVSYGDEKDDYFNSIILDDNDYLVAGYSSFENGSYYSKFIKYSDALKVLVTE